MPVSSAIKLLGANYEREVVAEVFITGELQRRPPGTSSFSDREAYAQIFDALARNPDAMLPKLVELALLYCEGNSAAISLYVPGDDQFVWHHLMGELAAFNGGSTPRHYSPCGVVLDTRSVVLVRKPERIYSWLSEAGISLPECLLVPLYDGSPEPIGTLWVVSSAPGHFTKVHAGMLTELADVCRLGLQLSWTREQIRAGLRDQEMLTREIERRIEKLNLTAEVQFRSDEKDKPELS